MFEPLTKHIPELQSSPFGHWNEQPKDADGSKEHPYVWPHVIYAPEICQLMDDIYAFAKAHPEFEHTRYSEILEEYGFSWGVDSMSNADVSNKDAKFVIALLIGAMRAERFCDGALLDFLSNGSIEKWLRRLEEIDD